jgi:tetratricopeptide (TPR) repeat protein
MWVLAMGFENGKSASELLADGEQALAAGESEQAFEMLDRARQLGVEPDSVQRFAWCYARAARFVNRQPDVLAWIEEALESAVDPVQRGAFLTARIAVCRQIDVHRVLGIADEALASADALADEEAWAAIISHAAFAAYRMGKKRTAARYAEMAERRLLQSDSARYDALRARMFALTALGKSEESLSVSRQARDLAIAVHRRADAANESNNVAETLLELGHPEQARDEATVAAELAVESGHRQVELFARVLMAVATAEVGNLDPALEMLRKVDSHTVNPIFAMDAAAAEAFWLLERGAASDAERAREVAQRAIGESGDSGVSNRLTVLYSQLARSWARAGDRDSARAALENARRLLDRTEPQSELALALAFTEVFPVSDAQRRTALTNARNRILRGAALREDPRAYCVGVRLHRRLLELSGGVPTDMLG